VVLRRKKPGKQFAESISRLHFRRLPACFGCFRHFGKAGFIPRATANRTAFRIFIAGVAEEGLGADADQQSCASDALLDVMTSLSPPFQAEVFGPGNQMAIHVGLFGDAVVLEFEIKIIRPKGLLEQSMASRALGKRFRVRMLRESRWPNNPKRASILLCCVASSSCRWRGL